MSVAVLWRLFRMTAAIVACLVGWMQPSPVLAQAERYELGRRLRAFEAAWEQQPAPEVRREALAALEPLTQQFFSFRMDQAGYTLDQARWILEGVSSPDPVTQWAAALQAVPAKRLVDSSEEEIEVTLRPLYKPKEALPPKVELRLWFQEKPVVVVPCRQFPVTVRVPLPRLGNHAGLDRRLYVLLDDGRQRKPWTVMVSQVRQLPQRLEKLEAAMAAGPLTFETATVRTRLQWLRTAMNGGVQDTDIPYAELLANAEVMILEPFFAPQRSGQFWVTVPVAEQRGVPCRLFVPRGLRPSAPVPLVVALHGAGVDENMFFESYGAGQIVRECQQRGWLLVAPRAGLIGPPPVESLVEALATRYPIDRQQIFLVGHSMGAAHALTIATGNPKGFAAVAALGGGGRLTPEPWRQTPLFIGVGTKDSLAIGRGRTMYRSLREDKTVRITYREYPDVEHLVIVRQALPDVFVLFDEVHAGRKK